MTRFPLRYARRNILVGPGGEAAALYRVETLSYPFLPVAEKWSLLHRLERLLAVVGADFSLWRVTRAYPVESYSAELDWLADGRHADAERWRAYLAGQQDRLGDLDPHLPEVYLAISLSDPRAGGGLVRSVDRARRRLEELAGVAAPRPIGSEELRSLAEAER